MNYELAILNALNKNKIDLDAEKITADFLDSIQHQKDVEDLLVKLNALNAKMLTGNVIHTTVEADVAAARNEMLEWQTKRAVALQQDIDTNKKIIGGFVAAIGLAAAGAGGGGLSVATVLPVVMGLISSISEAS